MILPSECVHFNLENAVVVSFLQVHRDQSVVGKATKAKHFAVPSSRQNSSKMTVAHAHKTSRLLPTDRLVTTRDQFLITEAKEPFVLCRLERHRPIALFVDVEDFSVVQLFRVHIILLRNEPFLRIDAHNKLIRHGADCLARTDASTQI